MKFLERACIVIMSCWGLYAVHEGVNALVRAHNWQPMTISDWGTWAGAIGTIAAVLASFFLFRRQREHELARARDADLEKKTNAVQTVHDVLFWSIETVNKCIDIREGQFRSGEAPDVSNRLDELRVLLDRFVTPDADRICALTALFFSNALIETKGDYRIPYDYQNDFVTVRMVERRDTMLKFQASVAVHMNKLLDECAARGIDNR